MHVARVYNGAVGCTMNTVRRVLQNTGEGWDYTSGIKLLVRESIIYVLCSQSHGDVSQKRPLGDPSRGKIYRVTLGILVIS
jgi:hypothetical protein